MVKWIERRKCGKIINTHGFRGTVKLESWCDAPQILASLDTVWFRKNKEYFVNNKKEGVGA